ncbi:unnamed protein product [Anisakis simplex]|uniref:ADAM family mig-17 (inferred by orthology to a C. elegans protein) n=1 Tax=Anisakis simplex TaxID=6269 RepID=A0A158PNX5_ANISI|nr:unnamed protein product [Anisakis simplex]
MLTRAHQLLTDTYEIDILMVADYSLYSGFIEMANGDEYSAQFAVNNYLNAIFEQVRAIYEMNKINDNEIVSLNLIATFVVIRPEDCPLMQVNDFNSTIYGGTNGTDNITSDANDYEFDNSTRFDLLSSKGDSSTQGMAYVGSMCRGNGESSSVVEDIGAMATSMIAAHELAHRFLDPSEGPNEMNRKQMRNMECYSLGAFHDGSGDSSSCAGTLNYMMAPMVSGSEDEHKFINSFKLSQCSMKQIEAFLTNGTSLCLRRHRGYEKRPRRTSSSEGRKKPGEIFLQQHQCKIAFGPHYGVCKHPEYQKRKDPCKRLWCKNRNTKRTASCETKGYLPMFDGTKCGTNKWCIFGKCVDNGNEEDSLVVTFEILGCVDLNTTMCDTLSMVKRKRFCKSVKFRSICCFTCSTLKSDKKS